MRWRAFLEDFSLCRCGTTRADRLRLRLALLSSRLHAACPTFQADRSVELKTLVGQRVLTVPIRLTSDDWYAYIEVFHNREYEVPLTPRNVLDIGANVGYACLYFAACFPDVQLAAVEPHPGNAKQMRHVLGRNGVNAHIIEAAAAVERGDAKLYLRGSTCHSLLPEHDFPHCGAIPVKTWSLTEILDDCGWDNLDLLKVDVEGYERLLLNAQNRSLSRVKAIIGEVHGESTANAIQASLQDLGFHVRLAVKHHSRLFLAMRK